MAASSREAADLELVEVSLRIAIAQVVIGYNPQPLSERVMQIGEYLIHLE